MNNKSLILLTLLGLPGSGKGTQGARIADEYGFQYLSTGALVRRGCDKHTGRSQFCLDLRRRFEKGIPQTNKTIKKLIFDELVERTIRKGLILDSYPLSIGQIADLHTIAEDLFGEYRHVVIYLDVKEKVLIERISKRKVCLEDEITYTPKDKAYKLGVCRNGHPLVRRKDDAPEVVKHRIEVYTKRLSKLLDYFEDHDELIRINAEGTPLEVHKRIKKALDIII